MQAAPTDQRPRAAGGGARQIFARGAPAAAGPHRQPQLGQDLALQPAYRA